ncbi:MAG: FecR family protein [Hyphomicrobiaceae bacterium]
MMRSSLNCLGAALVATMAWLGAVSAADAADAVGKVSRIRGEAVAVRGDTRVALSEGSPIEHLDRLETGSDTRLEITLLDDTKLTLGERAKVTVDTFVYDPGASKGEAVLQLVKGAMRFTTGKIGDMSNKNVSVRTTFATLAVRGTDFWAGPIDGTNGVLLLTGKVEVETKRGKALLDSPRNGVTVGSINRKPGKVRIWSDPKATRALDQTAF